MKIQNFIQQSPSTIMVLNGLAVQQKVKSELRTLGLNLNLLQALVLAAVFFEQPKAVMVTKIVQATGLSKSNVSQIISHLEAEDLIKRKLDVEDQRIWLLTTTKKAVSVVTKVVSYFDAAQKKTEDSFSEKELRTFFDISKHAYNLTHS